MMTTDLIRIFVNAQPVDAEPDDTVMTAIERWDAGIGRTLHDGSRVLTDSRGLVTALDTPVYNGAIFRVVSNRQLRESNDPYED